MSGTTGPRPRGPWAGLASVRLGARSRRRHRPGRRAPMDARSPLSPRASAFSITSLVAAEASEHTTRLGPGSSERVKLRRLLGSPAGMHFSTVTRDMEGEPSCWFRTDTGRPRRCCLGPAKRGGRAPTRGGGGSSGGWAPGFQPRLGAERKGGHPAQRLCTLQLGAPAADTRTQPDTGPERAIGAG